MKKVLNVVLTAGQWVLDWVFELIMSLSEEDDEDTDWPTSEETE